MIKAERKKFLQQGGTLVGAGMTPNGIPIIKVKTLTKDWHKYRLAPRFCNKTERDDFIKTMLENTNLKEV